MFILIPHSLEVTSIVAWPDDPAKSFSFSNVQLGPPYGSLLFHAPPLSTAFGNAWCRALVSRGQSTSNHGIFVRVPVVESVSEVSVHGCDCK